mgnify:CR=1 FL=1
MNWPAYEKYKEAAGSDSIPDHWQVVKLRHLLKVNPSVPEGLRANEDEMATFLPMEAVGEDGSLDTTRARPIRELLTGYSYFANGDVIMAKVTPCFENGKAAIIETLPTTDGFGTSEVTTLRPGHDLDQRFLGYLVRSDRFRQSSIAAMTGAGGLKRVPDEHVRSFQIGLPSVAEQYGIVDFLDRETVKIDALIGKQEQLIATLREAVEDIRRSELERLGNRLSDLSDEQRAQVEMLTSSIVNKILHVPTVKMKEVAGRDQCYLYVDAVRTLFDLDDGDDDGRPSQEAAEPAEPSRPRRLGAEACEESGGTLHHLRDTGTERA